MGARYISILGALRTSGLFRVHQVNIHVPAPELQSDIIAITGLAANLDRAKAGLLERVRELRAEQEDRVSARRGCGHFLPGCGSQPCSMRIARGF